MTDAPATTRRSQAPGLVLVVVGLAITVASGFVLSRPEPPPQKILSPEGIELQGVVRDVSAAEEFLKSGLPIIGVGMGAVCLLGGVFMLGRARAPARGSQG